MSGWRSFAQRNLHPRCSVTSALSLTGGPMPEQENCGAASFSPEQHNLRGLAGLTVVVVLLLVGLLAFLRYLL